MEFARQMPRLLHQEHLATIQLLERLERLLIRHHPGHPPAPDDDVGRLLGDLAGNLENETGRHFWVEQNRLFPMLGGGETMISIVLTGEHEAILPVAERLAALARAARAEGAFPAPAWDEFHQLGLELIERHISHIQKEEMALLPMLDDILDEETDQALAADYMAQT